jgi:hypothetical protein
VLSSDSGQHFANTVFSVVTVVSATFGLSTSEHACLEALTTLGTLRYDKSELVLTHQLESDLCQTYSDVNNCRTISDSRSKINVKRSVKAFAYKVVWLRLAFSGS